MKKTSTLLTFALALGMTQLEAQQVSQSEALLRAQTFLQQQMGHRAVSRNGESAATLTLAYTSQREADQRPLYYVFNQGQDEGFVIVGGDESAEQILGYCEHGSFCESDLPDNFRWWLSQYDMQISAAIDQGASMEQRQQAGGRRAAAANGRRDIGPLVKAKWNQSAPYYNLINEELEKVTNGAKYNFVTGCVATAIAQVMKHYNYPTQGTGSHSYSINYGSFTFTPSANFATTYDWDNMRILDNKEVDSYSGDYTEAQAAAVAKLMYHVGVSVDMSYNNAVSGGSGASSSKIPYALSTYFGYDKSISYEERKYYNDEDWESMVYNELANGRPVLYGGQATKGGHEFICDGYRASDGLYSFNWGWGSYCDGYYAMTGDYALKPNGSGTGGAGEGSAYTGSQDIIINVMPNAGGKERPILAENYANSISLKVDGSTVTSYNYTKTTDKQNATLTTNVWNLSTSLTSFTMGVRALDRNTGMVHYWTCQEINLARTYLGDIDLAIDLSGIEYNGTYELRPVCRRTDSNSNADWVLVKALNTDVFPEVIVTGAKAVESSEVNFQLSANQVQVGRTIQIEHDAAYEGNITYSGYDTDIIEVDTDGVVTGKAVGTTTITVTGASYSINGNELFKQTTKQLSVEVIATVKTTPVVSISSEAININGSATITVEGYEGTEAITYTSDNTAVATVSTDGTVTPVAEGTVKITVNVPATSTTNAVTKVFEVTVSNYNILMVGQPYMTNDEDVNKRLIVYVTLKNVGTSSAVEMFYYHPQVSGYTCNVGGYQIQLPAGRSTELCINMSNFQSILSEGTTVTLNFYRDAELTIAANIPSYTFTYHNTRPTHSMSAVGWATITTPVNEGIRTDKDWKFYSCSSIDGDVLQLVEVTYLKRNTPYIVSGPEGTILLDEYETEWVDSRLLMTNGLLSGVLSDDAYTFQEGDYILQKQGSEVAFYPVTASSPKLGKPASALRAFLRLPASNNASVRFPGNDEEEGIEQIQVDAPTLPAGIYGLDGKRRATLQPGLNIVVDEDGRVIKMHVASGN